MGYGSYTASDWSRLKASRKIEGTSYNELFAHKMNDKFDPKYINKREARDSEEHAYSTPIMIGVDVTGSMGYLSSNIIKKSLNELMQKLYSTDMIKDPQLLFAAIGDATCDAAPLQVTQFESDIRIAEQLLELWLENRGGDSPEDYPLLWYFAAKHTDIDCFNKRGEKGFCFTIGDADCHSEISSSSFERVFGDKTPKMTADKIAAEAGKSFEVFHIMIDKHPAKEINAAIPGRVAYIGRDEIDYLPELIISIMQISRGMDKETVLGQWGSLAKQVVKQSLSTVSVGKKSF